MNTYYDLTDEQYNMIKTLDSYFQDIENLNDMAISLKDANKLYDDLTDYAKDNVYQVFNGINIERLNAKIANLINEAIVIINKLIESFGYDTEYQLKEYYIGYDQSYISYYFNTIGMEFLIDEGYIDLTYVDR